MGSVSAEYMHTKLGISTEEIPHKCYEYYSNFGTTMAGLAVSAPVGFKLPVGGGQLEVSAFARWSRSLVSGPANGAPVHRFWAGKEGVHESA